MRLPVDRSFSLRGFGTVATGTLVSGTLGVEDEVQVLPGATRAKVRGLHVHGQARSTAVAGERVAVNLSGLEVGDVPRGSVLAAPAAFLPTRRADVELTLLPGVAPLKHGARLRLHHGTAELLARVAVGGGRGPWSVGTGPPEVRRPGRSRSRGSLHPAHLFAAGDDRRRRGARSRSAAGRDPHTAWRGALRGPAVATRPTMATGARRCGN